MKLFECKLFWKKEVIGYGSEKWFDISKGYQIDRKYIEYKLTNKITGCVRYSRKFLEYE
jgi:hypothetical protein